VTVAVGPLAAQGELLKTLSSPFGLSTL